MTTPTLETGSLPSPERSRALTIADLGAPSWQTSVTLVAYLLRSFASRVRSSTSDEYRVSNPPE